MTESSSSRGTLPPVPKVYQEFWDMWQSVEQRQVLLDTYHRKQLSFVPHLLPEQAMQIPGEEVLETLRQRLGEAVDLALSPLHTDPDNLPVDLPDALRSPVADWVDGGWLKRTNMVGINVRTVGSFWNIIKYVLTLPAAQDSIHLLPIWEAGVVGSMYGMSSWELNREFYSEELAALCPWLDTIGKQLRAVVNLLHGMGRTVGMDVIPHTDRFSEMTLAYPEYFEWLQRQDTVIVDHSADLHEKVQERIIHFLRAQGSAVAGEETPTTRDALFDEGVDEARRLRILFGLPDDVEGRRARRIQLITYLYRYGYEPVPATMAPPFRGLQLDLRPEAMTVDATGLAWREYLITEPTPMSRVFGPLARYKLYERLDNNARWEIDFSRPRAAVWRYIGEKYYQVQQRYGFDFMRGDMAHVQMRSEGVPLSVDLYYDILGTVKRYIWEEAVPYFGYFAETFLAPRDVMGYGEEIDHLEAAGANTTLGDLQSTTVGTAEFLQRFRYYYDLLETRLCTPNFTIMTADKDDPRFDEFYLAGNEARLFIAFFLTDMPSYMGLGFETRDPHFEPAPNEHYTKLFVFQETMGPKKTEGPYVWGRNAPLYSTITRMKLYLETIWERLRGRPCRWLIAPDATAENKVIAWTQGDARPDFLFVVNTDTVLPSGRFAIPHVDHNAPLRCDFSTAPIIPSADERLTFNGVHYHISQLAPGEGRVYRLEYDRTEPESEPGRDS